MTQEKQATYDFYTPRQLAQRLQVREQAITKWLRAGKIKGIRVGYDWRISSEEYERVQREGINPDTQR